MRSTLEVSMNDWIMGFLLRGLVFHNRNILLWRKFAFVLLPIFLHLSSQGWSLSDLIVVVDVDAHALRMSIVNLLTHSCVMACSCMTGTLTLHFLFLFPRAVPLVIHHLIFFLAFDI
jgi:hypothetical protein